MNLQLFFLMTCACKLLLRIFFFVKFPVKPPVLPALRDHQTAAVELFLVSSTFPWSLSFQLNLCLFLRKEKSQNDRLMIISVNINRDICKFNYCTAVLQNKTCMFWRSMNRLCKPGHLEKYKRCKCTNVVRCTVYNK